VNRAAAQVVDGLGGSVAEDEAGGWSVQGGVLFETVHRHKDGRLIPVEVSSRWS